ncbi:MAG: hypothetical protein HKN93_03800 [Acidimicrobiia bacterium]|nr:hypothetical protein [Acidimicrobiia bacterium]
MTVGNIIALRQTNLVRLLGFSSIAQAGFMLVPFGAAAAANGEQLEGAFFATVAYLLIYAVMNLGAFAVVIAVSKRIGSAEIDDWGGLFSYSPAMATLLGVFFFSLAGVPPLGGWFAKFVVFRAAISVGDGWGYTLAVIAVINAVIAFYYYARVIKSAWMDSVPAHVDAGEVKPVPSLRLALGMTGFGVIVLGFFPGIAAHLADLTKSVASGIGL